MSTLLTTFLTLPLKLKPKWLGQTQDWSWDTKCPIKISPAHQWHHLRKAASLHICHITFPVHMQFAHRYSNSPSPAHTGNTCIRSKAEVSPGTGAPCRLAYMHLRRPWLWELLDTGRNSEVPGFWSTSWSEPEHPNEGHLLNYCYPLHSRGWVPKSLSLFAKVNVRFQDKDCLPLRGTRRMDLEA